MRIDIHHIHHVDPTLVRAIADLRKDIMATLKDVQDKIAALQTEVANEATVDKSVVTLITGLSAQVKDLQKQLADAIANNDPVAIQAAADGLDALQKSMTDNAATLSGAVTTNP